LPGGVNEGWCQSEKISGDPDLQEVFKVNVNVLITDEDRYCDPATGAGTFGLLLCRVYHLADFSAEP
jgi:hypothetical protein